MGGGGKKAGAPASKGSVEDIDSILKEEAKANKDQNKLRISLGERVMLALLALSLASLPHLFYFSPMYDLSFGEHGAQFTGVSVLGGALLTYAYLTIATRKEAKLLKQRNISIKGKLAKDEKEALQGAVMNSTTLEALAWAVFVSNAFFLTFFLLLQFWFCMAYEVPIAATQAISILLPVVFLAVFPGLFAR